MTELFIVIFVVLGAVASYAAGYFRERSVPAVEPPPEETPATEDDCLRALLNAYSEEVNAKYDRNHSRRRTDVFLKEFSLASYHLTLFVAMAIAGSLIDLFEPALFAIVFLIGLTFLTLALKAGQLTAAKETVERKEVILAKKTELVNKARRDMMAVCPRDLWVAAMNVRDEKSPLHY